MTWQEFVSDELHRKNTSSNKLAAESNGKTSLNHNREVCYHLLQAGETSPHDHTPTTPTLTQLHVANIGTRDWPELMHEIQSNPTGKISAFFRVFLFHCGLPTDDMLLCRCWLTDALIYYAMSVRTRCRKYKTYARRRVPAIRITHA